MRHAARVLGLVAIVVLAVVGSETPSQAQLPPIPSWSPIGQVRIDKDGCSSCPASFGTSIRHRGFALATDSLYPISLTGRVDITCGNGATYNVFLNSPARGGVFQVIPTHCVNFDVKEVKLTITTVGLSPPDLDRSALLTIYGTVG